jgi:DNA-binding MarR family transcriptional regulator
MKDFITAQAREYQLSTTQIKTLFILNQYGNSPMSQLCLKTGLEKGSMTSVIDNLLSRMLVVRRRSQSDRRRVIVSLTDEGQVVSDELLRRMHIDFEGKLSTLPADQKLAFHQALHTLKETMDTLENMLHE